MYLTVLIKLEVIQVYLFVIFQDEIWSLVYSLLFQLVPAKVTDFPDKLKAIEGRNVSITCKAKGKPPAKIVWLKDGAPRKNGPRYYVTGKLSDNTYQTVSTLILPFATRDDDGIYTCDARNQPYGSQQKKVTLSLMCKYGKQMIVG